MPGIEISKFYKHCMLCPRKCGVDRYEQKGFCGAGVTARLAKAMLHMWEEPVLSGKGGAGAVFFSHCTLGCIYCQNHAISAGGFGRDISIGSLSDVFLELQDEGAQVIDLVTPSHFLPSVIAALDKAKHSLHIPVVYNCGGYESADMLKLLKGYVDIYLPDIKYFDDDLAVKYSRAPGYYSIACGALEEMLRQTGSPVINKDGAMERGTIIRHMVLPSHRDDSIKLLRGMAERFGTNGYLISLMSQYTPFYLAKTDSSYKEINRRIFSFEYEGIVEEALSLGMRGFMQEKSSAKEEYTPAFDLEGVPLC